MIIDDDICHNNDDDDYDDKDTLGYTGNEKKTV